MGLAGYFQVIILDQRIPSLSGMEVPAKLEESDIDCRCIKLTSHAYADMAFKTVSHEIVFQCMLKPFNGEAERNSFHP
jgi:FixJ family two-component response regulator